MIILRITPEPKPPTDARSRIGKLDHEFRYIWMIRRFKSNRRVHELGHQAGFWGRAKRCPFKDGSLRGAWLTGYAEGRDEREKTREARHA